MIVDYTTLRTVAECSTKAAMGAVLHYRRPPGIHLALEAGIGAHAALAVWLESQDIPTALSAFEAHYRPIWEQAVKAGSVTPSEEERLAWPIVRRVLRHWMKTAAFPYTVEPGMTEIAVTKKLGGEDTYVALIDSVVRSRVGGRWLCDHKTTSSLGPWWVDQQETSGQYIGQVWAATESLGEVEGVVVNGIAFPRLNTSSKKCYKHGVAYHECALEHCERVVKTIPVTSGEIASYAATVTTQVKKLRRIQQQVETLKDIAGQPMEGRLNGACKICDFKDWCKVGRPVSQAERFPVEVWNPLEEAKARRVRKAG